MNLFTKTGGCKKGNKKWPLGKQLTNSTDNQIQKDNHRHEKLELSKIKIKKQSKQSLL